MARPAGKRDKTRLNLEVTRPVRERLERLRDLSDADSMTEVIRRAVAVYEVLLDHREKGFETVIRNQDGAERLVLIP